MRRPLLSPRTEPERPAAPRGETLAPANPLRTRYEAVRRMTEDLARPLSSEDCQIQSMPDASPTKWHLAHTSWFFETFVLGQYAPGFQAFDQTFKFLFNSYYNSVGERLSRPSRGLITRPSLDEVYAYRAKVDQAMLSYFESSGDLLDAKIASVIELGLNHEQQHQELILTDIKHAFAQNPLRPAYRDGVGVSAVSSSGPMEWHSHPGGLLWIGHDGVGFGFDNESPCHRVFLEPYELGSRLVTCGEFAAFIDDGGYSRPELWLSDGWSVVSTQKWKMPFYWEKGDAEYWLMTLGGFRRVNESEPVCHVSFYEADAFARWASARLPTEFEWESAARQLERTGQFLESWRIPPASRRSWHALCTVFRVRLGVDPECVFALSGIAPESGALGEYNAKFMCNQFVLRGGSCVTPASHIRATYRNFFPPEARWQFTGVRLAKDT